MTTPLQKLGAQYQLLGRTIDSSLRRMREIGAEEEVLVLQGAYLFGVRAFEAFLERQLVHLCAPDVTWGPKVSRGNLRRFKKRLAEAKVRRVKRFLTMGKEYADYLPYTKTIEKANLLFSAGRPFTLLDSDQKDVIKRAHTVRNLIAHESDHALAQFKKVVCGRYPLRPEVQNAAGYILYEQILGTPMIRQDLEGLLTIANFLS